MFRLNYKEYLDSHQQVHLGKHQLYLIDLFSGVFGSGDKDGKNYHLVNLDDEMIKTLAHEMVHVKQFLRKELKEVRHQLYWLGEPSDKEEWEDEAYLMEEQLYNEYMNERTI